MREPRYRKYVYLYNLHAVVFAWSLIGLSEEPFEALFTLIFRSYTRYASRCMRRRLNN